MSAVALCISGTVLTWDTILIALAVPACFLALWSAYGAWGGRAAAVWALLPLSCLLSPGVSRLMFWYCHQEQFSSLAAAFAKGLESTGVKGCYKHLVANNAEAKSVVKGSKPTDKEKAVDRNVGKTSQQTVNSNLETAKKDSTETTECNEENRVSDVSDAHEKEDSKLASADKTAAKSVSMNDNDNVSSARESTSVVDNNNENETAVLLETLSMKLYNSISQDLSRQKDAVISAIAESGAALSKSLGLLQGEVNNSRDVAAENVRLKTRIAELEQQLAEQTVRIHEADNSIKLLESEMNDINTKFAAIQSKNAELDTKLAEAYAINSRESSLEAERIRSELKKAFIYLYEDWLEYEFSDVSEENYESLQAIIKKIFRSLERNGIDFKGSNE